MIKQAALLSTIALTSVLFAGCGKNQDSANFKVQLNSSSTLLYTSTIHMNALTAAPTSLTAQLGGVDLLRDCTNGAPPGSCDTSKNDPDPDIWVNAGCNNDIAQCTTSNTNAFELISPTVANEELNSQGRSIEVGTYTHVRIYFLGGGITCNGAASAATPAFPIQVALPAPLTVSKGDSITVTLNYDPASISNCNNATEVQSVFSNMTATVTKN